METQSPFGFRHSKEEGRKTSNGTMENRESFISAEDSSFIRGQDLHGGTFLRDV